MGLGKRHRPGEIPGWPLTSVGSCQSVTCVWAVARVGAAPANTAAAQRGSEGPCAHSTAANGADGGTGRGPLWGHSGGAQTPRSVPGRNSSDTVGRRAEGAEGRGRP